jgi:hypothetical protein
MTDATIEAQREALRDRVMHNMTLQPVSVETGQRMDAIRDTFKAVALVVIDQTVPSREQSMALTELEDALQHTIAAMARYPEEP